jgi:hypothetical protein
MVRSSATFEITPDYSKSVVEVFVLATQRMIEEDCSVHRVLNTKTMAYLGEIGLSAIWVPSEGLPAWPSWLLDWSVTSLSGRHEMSDLYQAGSCKTAKIFPQQNPLVLNIEGVFIDELTAPPISPSLPGLVKEESESRDWMKFLDQQRDITYAPTGENALDALWHTWIRNSSFFLKSLVIGIWQGHIPAFRIAFRLLFQHPHLATNRVSEEVLAAMIRDCDVDDQNLT